MFIFRSSVIAGSQLAQLCVCETEQETVSVAEFCRGSYTPAQFNRINPARRRRRQREWNTKQTVLFPGHCVLYVYCLT